MLKVCTKESSALQPRFAARPSTSLYANMASYIDKEIMSFRYSRVQRWIIALYRKLVPVPRSPWTDGDVEDICAVNLVPPETLESFFAGCINRLRQVRGDEIGDYLEFGVFNGSSLGSMVKAAEQAEADMGFFGFDAFEGLPERSEEEDSGVWKKGFYACSYEQMQACLRRRGVDLAKITFVKGWYNKTLTPQMTKKHSITNPGIVFIDCDTYSSSKEALDFIGPIAKEPFIVCLDDWKLNDLDIKGMGEYKSFNEFVDEHPDWMFLEMPSYNRKSKTFLVTP